MKDGEGKKPGISSIWDANLQINELRIVDYK